MSVEWHTEVSGESCRFYNPEEFPKFLFEREGVVTAEAPTYHC